MTDHKIEPRTLGVLLISIGLVVFPHATHIAWPLFAFFCVLFAWRFLSLKYTFLLPGKLAILTLTLTAIGLLIWQHTGIWGRDSGTAIFVTALGLKLMEIRQSRDLYLTAYLAFFVATTQFLYEQNIIMAVYIFLVCSLLLCALTYINNVQIRFMAAAKLSATVILQAIPLMIVLFLFIPRIQAPKWDFLEQGQQGLSGLADSIEPGSFSNLALSEQLAFRVTFEGQRPLQQELYWRGPVLSFTDGKRWSYVNLNYRHHPPTTPEFLGNRFQYTILLEPQQHNWVYALELPSKFDKPLSQTADYHLITAKNPKERAEYSIESYSAYNTGELNRTDKRINLQLPGQASEEIVDFVKQLGGFNDTPLIFIQNLLNYFNRENFIYTLRPPLYPDEPVATFLFKGRRGFCSHYATAFVYLMRTAGIPARVVTGYQGGLYNNVGQFLEVRQANAHAWAEVWLPQRGWTRFDPTTAVAPERVQQNFNIEQLISTGEVLFSPLGDRELSFLQKAKFYWQNIDYQWHRWVINYNAESQSGLLSFLGIKNLRQWIIWLTSLTAVFTLLLSAILFRKQKKHVDEIQKIYMQFCSILAKNGIQKGACEGPLDFAERSARQFPKRANNINLITRLYIKIRYGRVHAQDDVLRFARLVQRFKTRH